MKFLGAPYPIEKHPRGLLHTQNGIDQVKSDMLALLLTNPGERVMLPEYGTPLNRLVFEPSDTMVIEMARDMIVQSIKNWEPRIAVQDIEVTTNGDEIKDSLDSYDTREQANHILMIRINFFDFDNITEVQELKLEVPLGG